MADAIAKLVSRSEMRSYMNTGTTAAPAFAMIGEGFTSLSEAKNPKEYSRQYVHERTERTDVVGYAPAISYSVDIYTNNPVIKKIRDVTDQELIGTDAQVEIVTAEHFGDAAVDETALTAYKRTYAIIPDAKGDGTEALVYTGTFKAVGDIVKGKFNAKDGSMAFTPDTDAAAQS